MYYTVLAESKLVSLLHNVSTFGELAHVSWFIELEQLKCFIGNLDSLILVDSVSQTFWSQDPFTLLKLLRTQKSFCLCGSYIYHTLEVKTDKILKYLLIHFNTTIEIYYLLT